MAESEKGCVICGGEEKDGELLVAAPCGRHWVCPDDITSFFERATQNESLFPPKCCGQMFMLQEYEDYVPFDVAWAYQVKEQGEYAILAKFRVYCGNPACAKFLQPSAHVTDQATKITYAICENETCGKLTCVGCKNLLDEGAQNHLCKKDENEEKFLQTAKENGYQECRICGATVELAEACNHITCSCGFDFCYLCGKEWMGTHGCPHYGHATSDAEGYNQDGYHHETGLNRESLTRRQEMARRRGEDPDADEEDDGEEDDDEWDVIQHLAPEERLNINVLHDPERDDALDNLRIQLFEEQGVLFGADLPAPIPPVPAPNLPQHVVSQIEDRILAADENPVVRALFAQLRDGYPDAQTATQIVHRIAELHAESIGPQLAAQALTVLVAANNTSSIVPNLNPEQTFEFVQHFIHRLTLLAARAPAGHGEEQGEGEVAAPEADEEPDDPEHTDDTDVPEFETDEPSSHDGAPNLGDHFVVQEAVGHGERSIDHQSADKPDFEGFPGLYGHVETAQAALTPAQATRLHYQNHQATAEDQVTTPESKDEPKTPEDHGMSENEDGKRTETSLEAGARRIWGPPGGWPRGEEEL